MKRVPLGEVLELADSGVWGPEDVAEGVSVLRSTNFRNDGTLNFSSIALRSIDPRKRVSKLLLPGDILLEKSGGGPMQPVGRVCRFEGSGQPHAFGNFLARLRPRGNMRSEYLCYFLRYFHRTGQTNSYQKQTTGIRNLEFSRYLTIEVPCPAEVVQSKEADKLARAEGILRLRREAQRKAAELIPALFLDRFGDPASNPKHWQSTTLGQLVDRFEGGKNIQAGDEGASPYRILKISAVTSGMYRESESKPAPVNITPPRSHVVRKGDLLISRANTEALVGAVAFVEATNGATLLPDKLWRLVWRPGAPINPTFALHLLQLPSMRKELSALASGTGGSMKNISQAKLRELRVMVPPLPEQEAFAVHAGAVASILRMQADAVAKAQAAFDALLHRAFAS